MGRDEIKHLKHKSIPKYHGELIFVTINLFFLKFMVSEQFFESMTFFMIAIPFLGCLLISTFMKLYKLLQLMHVEALETEGAVGGLGEIECREGPMMQGALCRRSK